MLGISLCEYGCSGRGSNNIIHTYHISTYAHVYYIHLHIYIYLHLYIHTHIHVCVCVCVCVCTERSSTKVVRVMSTLSPGVSSPHTGDTDSHCLQNSGSSC